MAAAGGGSSLVLVKEHVEHTSLLLTEGHKAGTARVHPYLPEHIGLTTSSGCLHLVKLTPSNRFSQVVAKFQLHIAADDGVAGLLRPVRKEWALFEFHEEDGLLLVQRGSNKLLFVQLPLMEGEAGNVFLFGTHVGEILALAKNARYLASGSADGVVSLWDMDTGAQLDMQAQRGMAQITALAYAGPLMVAAGSDTGEVVMLDISTRQLQAVQRFRADTGPITALAARLSAHTMYATATAGGPRGLDGGGLVGGPMGLPWRLPPFAEGPEGGAAAVTDVKDTLLAVASTAGWLHVYGPVRAGERAWEKLYSGTVAGRPIMAFSPDGTHLALATGISAGQLTVMDVGRALQPLKQYSFPSPLSAMGFLIPGTQLATMPGGDIPSAALQLNMYAAPSLEMPVSVQAILPLYSPQEAEAAEDRSFLTSLAAQAASPPPTAYPAVRTQPAVSSPGRAILSPVRSTAAGAGGYAAAPYSPYGAGAAELAAAAEADVLLRSPETLEEAAAAAARAEAWQATRPSTQPAPRSWLTGAAPPKLEDLEQQQQQAAAAAAGSVRGEHSTTSTGSGARRSLALPAAAQAAAATSGEGHGIYDEDGHELESSSHFLLGDVAAAAAGASAAAASGVGRYGAADTAGEDDYEDGYGGEEGEAGDAEDQPRSQLPAAVATPPQERSPAAAAGAGAGAGVAFDFGTSLGAGVGGEWALASVGATPADEKPEYWRSRVTEDYGVGGWTPEGGQGEGAGAGGGGQAWRMEMSGDFGPLPAAPAPPHAAASDAAAPAQQGMGASMSASQGLSPERMRMIHEHREWEEEEAAASRALTPASGLPWQYQQQLEEGEGGAGEDGFGGSPGDERYGALEQTAYLGAQLRRIALGQDDGDDDDGRGDDGAGGYGAEGDDGSRILASGMLDTGGLQDLEATFVGGESLPRPLSYYQHPPQADAEPLHGDGAEHEHAYEGEGEGEAPLASTSTLLVPAGDDDADVSNYLQEQQRQQQQQGQEEEVQGQGQERWMNADVVSGGLSLAGPSSKAADAPRPKLSTRPVPRPHAGASQRMQIHDAEGLQHQPQQQQQTPPKPAIKFRGFKPNHAQLLKELRKAAAAPPPPPSSSSPGPPTAAAAASGPNASRTPPRRGEATHAPATTTTPPRGRGGSGVNTTRASTYTYTYAPAGSGTTSGGDVVGQAELYYPSDHPSAGGGGASPPQSLLQSPGGVLMGSPRSQCTVGATSALRADQYHYPPQQQQQARPRTPSQQQQAAASAAMHTRIHTQVPAPMSPRTTAAYEASGGGVSVSGASGAAGGAGVVNARVPRSSTSPHGVPGVNSSALLNKRMQVLGQTLTDVSNALSGVPSSMEALQAEEAAKRAATATTTVPRTAQVYPGLPPVDYAAVQPPKSTKQLHPGWVASRAARPELRSMWRPQDTQAEVCNTRGVAMYVRPTPAQVADFLLQM